MESGSQSATQSSSVDPLQSETRPLSPAESQRSPTSTSQARSALNPLSYLPSFECLSGLRRTSSSSRTWADTRNDWEIFLTAGAITGYIAYSFWPSFESARSVKDDTWDVAFDKGRDRLERLTRRPRIRSHGWFFG